MFLVGWEQGYLAIMTGLIKVIIHRIVFVFSTIEAVIDLNIYISEQVLIS